MDTLIIFGAKYLILLSPIITAYVFLRASREKKREMIVFACIFIPIAFILSLLARALYNDPRPFIVGDFQPLIVHAGDNGFPSDHTLLLATLAVLVSWFERERRYATLLWILVVIVGLSRVYVGVHHSIDILGSIAIALLAGSLTHAIIRRLWKPKTNS
jgi:undecaprenyl-diphosphatase